MPASDLSRVAVEAMRLQNGYALAVDARDWELFRTVFTPAGWIRWTMKDKPGSINRAEVLFRDRLSEDDGTWRIARRKLRMLSSQPDAPVPAGYTLVQSVLDLADWT